MKIRVEVDSYPDNSELVKVEIQAGDLFVAIPMTPRRAIELSSQLHAVADLVNSRRDQMRKAKG